jgi:hypothetical protein
MRVAVDHHGATAFEAEIHLSMGVAVGGEMLTRSDDPDAAG